jgi:signal transduction histidine kinase
MRRARPHREYRRRVVDIRRLWRQYALDALIVLGAVQAGLDVAFRQDPQRAPLTSVWFAAPAMGLIILTLLARRRFPFGAPVALWVSASALSFADVQAVIYTPAALVAGLAAAFLLGNLRVPVQSAIGLGIAAGSVLIIIYNDPSHSIGDLIFTPVQVATAWLAGWGVRLQATQAEAAEQRAETAERERESAARVAVAEERTRIARELHDIVAHSVSVMVLQVGAVRHRLPDTQAQDKEALRSVEQAGRAALTEMRRLLGAMRQDGQAADLAPQPGLDSLDALLGDVERAGLPVHLDHAGERVPLPRAIDLSAFRIIQEGLTNVLKHAHASHADVTIRYGSDDLQIQVSDDGRGAVPTDGHGHGLVGVRERVKIYGGEMSTGTAPGGGFVLNARLPLGARS